MAKKGEITRWQDCRDSRKVEKFARRNGIEIRNGKGDHKVMYHNGTQETFYGPGEMSNGVAHAVFRFFKAVGLAIIVIAIGLPCIMAQYAPELLVSLLGQ